MLLRQATSSNIKQCQAKRNKKKHSGPFWAILGHSGSFWAILGYSVQRPKCPKAQVPKGPSAQRPKGPKAQVPKIRTKRRKKTRKIKKEDEHFFFLHKNGPIQNIGS